MVVYPAMGPENVGDAVTKTIVMLSGELTPAIEITLVAEPVELLLLVDICEVATPEDGGPVELYGTVTRTVVSRVDTSNVLEYTVSV